MSLVQKNEAPLVRSHHPKFTQLVNSLRRREFRII